MKRRLRLTYGDTRVIGRLVCLFRHHRWDGGGLKVAQAGGLEFLHICTRCRSEKVVLAVGAQEAA